MRGGAEINVKTQAATQISSTAAPAPAANATRQIPRAMLWNLAIMPNL